MTENGTDRKWPLARGSGTTVFAATTAAGITLALWLAWNNAATMILLVTIVPTWLLVLYFFRDPNRKLSIEPGMVVGPGDGEVVEIAHAREDRYLKTETVRISLFLSIMDVHVQRVPLAGKVTEIEQQKGKYLQAFRPEASDVNEHIAMVLETKYGRILVKQIAGILARRCVNFLEPGDIVESGQRFGLIKFGSRIDLFLPPTARMMVSVGDKVYGGLTGIARLSEIDVR